MAILNGYYIVCVNIWLQYFKKWGVFCGGFVVNLGRLS